MESYYHKKPITNYHIINDVLPKQHKVNQTLQCGMTNHQK